MNYSFIVGVAIVMCGVSCQNSSAGDEKDLDQVLLDSLQEKVMIGHDEGMGRIGRLEKASAALSHKIDSVRNLKIADTAQLAVWSKAKTYLDASDSSMNRWMDEYDMDMPNMDMNQKVSYLNKNILQVGKITDSIKISLSQAESLLAQ